MDMTIIYIEKRQHIVSHSLIIWGNNKEGNKWEKNLGS